MCHSTGLFEHYFKQRCKIWRLSLSQYPLPSPAWKFNEPQPIPASPPQTNIGMTQDIV